MNAACLTEEEMHPCVVKAGISDEQKENSCILHLLCIYIYMLVTVACEPKDEAYLVVQVSLYSRSDNNYRSLSNLCNLFLKYWCCFPNGNNKD